METLTNSGLLSLISDAAGHPDIGITEEQLHVAWEAFLDMLERLTQNGCTPSLMRTLGYARVELESYYSRLESVEPPNRSVLCYCAKALGVIRCEIRILTLSLNHPGFSFENTAPAQSPLHLSDNYNLTCLVEIIASFHKLGVCCEQGKAKARLKTLVKIFEWGFNVSLENYDILRNAALNRSKNTTSFLDKLRQSLIDESQK